MFGVLSNSGKTKFVDPIMHTTVERQRTNEKYEKTTQRDIQLRVNRKILESIFGAHQWISHWPVNVLYTLLAQIEISSKNLRQIVYVLLDKCTVLPLLYPLIFTSFSWDNKHSHSIGWLHWLEIIFFLRKISIH